MEPDDFDQDQEDCRRRGVKRSELKAMWRWNGTRICSNCLHARELTEEEAQKYKNWPYYDKPNLFCQHTNKRAGIKPNPTCGWSHCFCHEYDDESVLLPKNPKWISQGVTNLWPYEEERAAELRKMQAQVQLDDIYLEDGQGDSA